MPSLSGSESSSEDLQSLENTREDSDSDTTSTTNVRRPAEVEPLQQREKGKKEYTVRKSRVLRIVDWTLLLRTYVPYVMFFAVSLLTIQLSYEIWMNQFAIGGAYRAILQSREVFQRTPGRMVLLGMGWKATAVLVVVLWLFLRGRRPVYLINFTVFEPPDSWKITHDEIMEILRRQKVFTKESIEFMARILEKSGTGPATAWPPGIVRCMTESGVKADTSVKAAREEAEIVIFDVVEQALAQTGTKPKDIDIIIVNCSLFSPTPSLCSMVIHHFGMKRDILSYNLSGMGCSAGLLAIDLARELLNSRPKSTALVISTEIITQNLYHGNERSMLLQNTLFRCGGAAIILSNKWQDAVRAKFKLLHTARVQGEGLESYESVFEREDDLGNHGVELSKNVVNVAGKAMQDNFTALGTKILPISEQILVVKSLAAQYLSHKLRAFLRSQNLNAYADRIPKRKTHIPNFRRAIDHFCIHAGGRGVIDGVQENLSLPDRHMESSRKALYNYGNTSSSSVWYELKYLVDSREIHRGQRILHIAFGSGFKCSSCIWLALNR